VRGANVVSVSTVRCEERSRSTGDAPTNGRSSSTVRCERTGRMEISALALCEEGKGAGRGESMRGGYGLAEAGIFKMQGQSPVRWTVGLSPLGERRSEERLSAGQEFEHRRCEVGLTGRGEHPPSPVSTHKDGVFQFSHPMMQECSPHPTRASRSSSAPAVLKLPPSAPLPAVVPRPKGAGAVRGDIRWESVYAMSDGLKDIQ